MRFGSTAKVLAECKLKYCRISEWKVPLCTPALAIHRQKLLWATPKVLKRAGKWSRLEAEHIWTVQELCSRLF